jgi:membrane protein DedA with SNARE-associated domain/membrane-associated phospholipid phosphatase
MSAGQIAAAVVAALLAAGVVWRRRQLGRERLLLALGLTIALAVYASGLLSKLPDPKKVIGDVATALGPWTYALVGVLAFLETGAFVGLVAPGETVVIAGGVIAGQGEIELLPLIGLVWACAVLGDTTSFFIGRRLGRRFLEKHGPRLAITEERLAQVESYFHRHGGKTILIGRFIGLVRALAPFVAGSSGVAYKRFIPFSVVGTGLWATVFCVLGYIFWQSFDRIAHLAGQAVFAFGVVAGVIVGVVVAYRRLRKPEERRKLAAWIDRQGEKPALRPLFAVARPIWRRALRPAWRAAAPRLRFLWERLTPGELGLEMTTSLAVAGVGTYTYVLFANIVADDPGPTPGDREWFDVLQHIDGSTGVEIAKFVSGLGALPTAIGVAIVTALVLIARKRPLEVVALAASLGVIVLLVHLAKAGIDRPRPEDSLIRTSGSAYPSGHAAYSATWVAAAALITYRQGLASRATIVMVAVILSAAIGISRIYLHAHYGSDVAGGWGLGYAVFGLAGIITLTVAYLRQNGDSAEP